MKVVKKKDIVDLKEIEKKKKETRVKCINRERGTLKKWIAVIMSRNGDEKSWRHGIWAKKRKAAE